jgi:hypothetical protein
MVVITSKKKKKIYPGTCNITRLYFIMLSTFMRIEFKLYIHVTLHRNTFLFK